MINVKRTFFITEKEAKKIRIDLDNPYIMHDMPHYELSDGTVLYGCAGTPAAYDRWYSTPPNKENRK